MEASDILTFDYAMDDELKDEREQESINLAGDANSLKNNHSDVKNSKSIDERKDNSVSTSVAVADSSSSKSNVKNGSNKKASEKGKSKNSLEKKDTLKSKSSTSVPVPVENKGSKEQEKGKEGNYVHIYSNALFPVSFTGKSASHCGRIVSQFKAKPTEYKLYVSGINEDTKASDLQDFFTKHAKIVDAKIIRFSKIPNQCFGLVTFDNESLMLKCIQTLNATSLKGNTISLSQNSPLKKQTKNTLQSNKGDGNKTSKKNEDVNSKVKDKEEVKINGQDAPKEKSNKDNSGKTTDNKSSTKEPAKGGKGDDKKKEAKEKKNDKDSGKEVKNKEKPKEKGKENERDHKDNKDKDDKSKDRDKRKDSEGTRSKDRARSRSRSPSRERRFNSYRRPGGGDGPYRRPMGPPRVYQSRINDFQKRDEMDRIRQERFRVQKEKEQLKMERIKLERERLEMLRLEREKIQKEREEIARRRQEVEEQQRKRTELAPLPPKRPFTIGRGSSPDHFHHHSHTHPPPPSTHHHSHHVPPIRRDDTGTRSFIDSRIESRPSSYKRKYESNFEFDSRRHSSSTSHDRDDRKDSYRRESRERRFDDSRRDRYSDKEPVANNGLIPSPRTFPPSADSRSSWSGPQVTSQWNSQSERWVTSFESSHPQSALSPSILPSSSNSISDIGYPTNYSGLSIGGISNSASYIHPTRRF